MCGLAGVFAYRGSDGANDGEAIRRMTRSLAHRGPDDEGFYDSAQVTLGHRRLSIVDILPTGHQPMISEAGSVIAYNGECYGHAALRTRLADAGYRFRGTSDTETLLYALETWGPHALENLSAIFAFASWSPQERRLVLARDPLGVKQLYYHDDGSRIVFASEIKALLHYPGVVPEVDPAGLNEYLHFHTPLFERTFFKGIRQVRPGEWLEVTRHGLRHRFFWRQDGCRPRPEPAEQQVAELKDELADVVAKQLMSDVPVGCFFSGGIDSSAVAAFALRQDQSLRGFGIHFSGQGVIDERPFQEAAARALGLDLELITLDGSSFPEDFLRLSYYQDSPVIGAAMLPMYHVSRLAGSKVKVCLGGQGADELFGGYARYALARPVRAAGQWLWRAGGGESGRSADDEAVGGNLAFQALDRHNLARFGLAIAASRGWRDRYFNNFTKIRPRTWDGVFAGAGVHNRAAARAIFEDTLDRSPATEPGDKLLHWDVQTYLPGLLHQDDRMSMANSLESRVPLADPRLLQFAFHTPFDMKIRDGASKWILRRAVADVLPQAVLNRRKVGFDTPAERWMRNQHAGFVRDLLLSARARTRGFWNPRTIEGILDRPQMPHWFDVVWKLVSIEAWATTFLDRNTPAGVPELPHAA